MSRPIGRPRRRARSAPTRLVGLGVGAIGLAAAALAFVGGGSDGLWLCAPLTLLAGACAGTARGSAASAAAVGTGALVASMAHTGGAGAAGRPAFAVVVVTCAAILIVVRERLAREADELRRYALTDPLTRIANRRSLMNRADYEIDRHRRSGGAFAVVMLDLDGFKALNDRFGHPAGDDLLRDVAASLQRAMRAQDTVARFGGDEFCVLAPETDDDGTSPLAARIAHAVGEVTVGVQTVRASLGVALFPADGTRPAELLDAADQRLLEAKRRRGGGRRGERRAAA
jgi:diguanylate cyclase (GGDEF)-like protein